MNCKPGDLAIIVCPDTYWSGRLVEILHAPPSQEYRLPDGHLAICDNNKEPCWVIRFIGNPVSAPLESGATRLTRYGCCRDSALRPLRGLFDDFERRAVEEAAQ